MFGFIADILTSIASILFPVFASYKALRTSDPASLAPWLMYWVTLSLVLLIENQFYFILSWVPFYSWMRLGLHLYLVAPGTQQGSVFLYQEYIHPFLEEHERQIDRMISDGHAKAKAAGLDAVKRVIDYVRVQFLGQEPRRPTPPNSRNVSYSTALLSRFNMPSAREGLAAAGTSDLFSMLGKAMSQSTYPDSTSRDAQARDLTESGSLIPPNLSGTERQNFVLTQRDRLATLLQAFDAESHVQPGTPGAGGSVGVSSSRSPGLGPSQNRPASRKSYLSPAAGASEEYLHQSRSESEFEDLAYEPMPDPDQYRPSRSDRDLDAEIEERLRHAGGRPSSGGSKSGGGWSNFIWGNYGERDSAIDPKKDR